MKQQDNNPNGKLFYFNEQDPILKGGGVDTWWREKQEKRRKELLEKQKIKASNIICVIRPVEKPGDID